MQPKHIASVQRLARITYHGLRLLFYPFVAVAALAVPKEPWIVASFTFSLFGFTGGVLIRSNHAALGIFLILIGAALAGTLVFFADELEGTGWSALPVRSRMKRLASFLIALSVAPLVGVALYASIHFHLDERTGTLPFVAASAWPALISRYCRSRIQWGSAVLGFLWLLGATGFYSHLWVGPSQTGWLFGASKGLLVLVMGGILADAVFSPDLKNMFSPLKTSMFAAGVIGLFVFNVLGYTLPGFLDSVFQKLCLLAVIFLGVSYFSEVISRS